MAGNNKVLGNNFNPFLVGQQFVADKGTPTFTVGNFQITTNLTPPKSRNFNIGSFNNGVTLESMGGDIDTAFNIIDDNLKIFLNLNTIDLSGYALFGSLEELMRSTLITILQQWPASIHVTGIYGASTGYTAENYSYDTVSNVASFRLNNKFISNKYNINYLANTIVLSGSSIPISSRNLSVNYANYSILLNNVEYNILGFTGSSSLVNTYFYIEVSGDPFSGLSTSNLSYHIKPRFSITESYINSVDDFSRFLLNRFTIPKYSSRFIYSEENENTGISVIVSKILTWPVVDGYNLDNNSARYAEYRNELFKIGQEYDKLTGDLMFRSLVTSSISDYTEIRNVNTSNLIAGERITKLLRIYGREYDEVKKWIDGISFVNNISYDKQGNLPDALIKDKARYLGWDVLSPMIDNTSLATFASTSSLYSGHSVGESLVESEIEFWRRIVLNSAYLWKSKGSRKGVEFFFDFIGIPSQMAVLNEHIYVAKDKIDIDVFKEILNSLYNNVDISSFSVDDDGYPKVPINTLTNYFQMAGLWYRETAGEHAFTDYYGGNNPHIGEYDGGSSYINNFLCLIGEFNPTDIKIKNNSIEIINNFKNYNFGEVDGIPTSGTVYHTIVNENNQAMPNCVSSTGTVITNPAPFISMSICGCQVPPNSSDKSIIINVDKFSSASGPCGSDPNVGILTSISGCSTFIPSDLVLSPQYIRYFNTITKTYVTQVPSECCHSTNSNVKWIEISGGLGNCYYTSPCSPTYEYVSTGYGGTLLFLEIATEQITSKVSYGSGIGVSPACCIYHGGIVDIVGNCVIP